MRLPWMELGTQEVCVLFSYMTLSKVRMLDSIVLHKGAALESLIKEKNIDQYSVIAQTILGGAFIGFGSRCSSEEDLGDDPSHFQSLSFISQGAIPPEQTFDLWSTYVKWKKQLLSAPENGFPLAYKLRPLKDILRENHIIP